MQAAGGWLILYGMRLEPAGDDDSVESVGEREPAAPDDMVAPPPAPPVRPAAPTLLRGSVAARMASRRPDW